MATLESDKVDKALRGKMQAARIDTGDWYYLIKDEDGIVIASTSLSKGSKHTLGAKRVSEMARQLNLDNVREFTELVRCTLSREAAIVIMKENS